MAARLILGTFVLGSIFSLALGQDPETSTADEQVAALNARIDKLDIMSDEILVRANSMNELELIVKAMEERQKTRRRTILARNAFARNRIKELNLEIQAVEIVEMEAKIKMLEEEAKTNPDSLNKKREASQARLVKLLEEVGKNVSLEPREGEKKVVLIERLLGEIKSLRAENDRLRQELAKP